MLTGVASFGCALHRLIHKSFVTTANRGGWGTAGTLIFWLQVPDMTLYKQPICPAGASLQMTGGHNSFRLYALVIVTTAPPPPAQENVEVIE